MLFFPLTTADVVIEGALCTCNSIQHRVSVSILCPLVRPKKAVGLESLIGSWLALEPTLSNACAASGAERVEHHRVMKPSSRRNHQLGWSRYRGSQDQNPSRSEAGLDASDNIPVPTEGKRRIFFLTSPFIGQLTEPGGTSMLLETLFV